MPVHRLSGQPGAAGQEEAMSIRFEDYEDAGVPGPSAVLTAEEKLQRMLDMVVGKQIARLTEFADPGPWGGATVGFIFRTHERAFYFTRPVPERLQGSGFLVMWAPQVMESQLIVTRSMEYAATHDRAGEQYTPNPLYRRLEGEVIKGATFLEEPNAWGGQTIRFELSGRMELHLLALPGRAHGLASRFSANYKLELKLPPKRSISDPGAPLVVSPTFIGGR